MSLITVDEVRLLTGLTSDEIDDLTLELIIEESENILEEILGTKLQVTTVTETVYPRGRKYPRLFLKAPIVEIHSIVDSENKAVEYRVYPETGIVVLQSSYTPPLTVNYDYGISNVNLVKALLTRLAGIITLTRLDDGEVNVVMGSLRIDYGDGRYSQKIRLLEQQFKSLYRQYRGIEVG